MATLPNESTTNGPTIEDIPDAQDAALNDNTIDTKQTVSEEIPLDQQTVEVFKIGIKTPVELGTINVQVTKFDLISDIHKYLQETTETCLHTSYNLVLNGQKLNEFSEMGSIQGIKDGAIIDMVPATYNERTSRLHIKRLSEIIETAQEESTLNNPSLFSCFSWTGENEIDQKRIEDEDLEQEAQQEEQEKPKKEPKASKTTTTSSVKSSSSKLSKKEEKQKEKENEQEERRMIITNVEGYKKPELKDFYPETMRKSIQCIRSISMSGWNPVPGLRKLSGDLFYLEIGVLDSQEIVHVTANSNGFFVNSSTSTTFNPAPSTTRAIHTHNLHELLQQISPLFQRGLSHILQSITRRHPFELVPPVVPSNSWICRPQVNKYTASRANESNLNLPDPELRAQPRDWNEELQSLKELGKDSVQERVLRDRALVKVNADFVDAATRGAQLVVNKSIPPINPLENERAHMFVYNNIFFSFSLDTRDTYAECGGDRAARAAANNDLRGVKLFNLVDVEGISTINTAIIDYRGHRVIAQSLVPGILSNEKTSVVHYGSMDSGKSIVADAEFHTRLQKIASMLHLAEREVCPSDLSKPPVKICTSFESKGIIGTDGRRYILDILRATPRDPNYPDAKHQMYVLRPELIANYTEYLKIEFEEKKKAAAQRKAEAGEQQKETTEPFEFNQEEPHVRFNPNLLSSVVLGGTEEEKQTDKEELEKIGEFLKEKMINRLVQDFTVFNSTPVDGQTLTAIMHSRGINIRYLGLISQLCSKIPFVKELCFNEMVSRAAKHIFNETLRQTDSSEMAITICHFLNCFLGTDTGSGILNNDNNNGNGNGNGNGNTTTSASTTTTTSNIKETKKQRQQRLLNQQYLDQMKQHSAKNRMSQKGLWEQIAQAVKEKYGSEITTHSVPIESRISVLRSLCLKTGLQIASSNYDFTKDEPFILGDIVELACVVKHLNPRSPDGIDMLEAGKAALANKRIDEARELLTEALTVCHQVHGAIHSDTAICYNNLAMAAFYAEQYDQAVEFQKNALIITEKTMGVDHHDTIHSYNNLALFCQRAHHPTEAMGYLKRVLYLTDLLGSEFSPERPSIYTSVAIILQEFRKFQLSIEFLLEAIKHQRRLFGEENIISTPCLHSIALVYAQLKDWKMAIQYERETKKILDKYLQPEHPRVKDSENYLRHFEAEFAMEHQAKLSELHRQQQLDIQRIQQQQQQQLLQVARKQKKENQQKKETKEPKENQQRERDNNNNNNAMNDNINEILSFVNGKKKSSKKSNK
ncbi:hypothetical protein DFA_00848 [Cavenderia fasciculata]|uniref:Clu domain-containing protein n=1 Tax=Cavenderia fasciculata TaxID=261658 RepID=F4PU53_CACFS|nr:uncharacterized protein DFA_00848 [Cavenderia fasciculata]EGG20979.1 hypothetical protein DFA_00848 [Cavenderia fasciculata]|eukprot:XP_004358829.1 hypothetical protein DFA_00848 [Cavenderia fasciculata]